MANELQRILSAATVNACKHSILLTNFFQLLLFLTFFETTSPLAAEITLMLALLMISAQILCIISGRYLYKFPGEMHI